MTSHQLRAMFLRFFQEKGHALIPSASLIPENDPSVLFTTAGMHPLVPYLKGAPHPAGKRLVDVQKCLRTDDIEEVGDSSHCTFFEMLGNWSLGDYFKKESIAWSWEFLTSADWLNLPKERLAFSCFAGDEDAPRDTEAAQYWIDNGAAESSVYFLGKKYNWWGLAGQAGPCGPDTEIFYITEKPKCGPDCSPACDCGHFLEIWNNVFMAYDKTNDGKIEVLAQQNVDTGMGLDRTVAVLQGLSSIYETEDYQPIMNKIVQLSGENELDAAQTTRARRIIADHVRSATFILGDQRGVTPSNADQGYILRRLIRRAIRYMLQLGAAENQLSAIAAVVVAQYGDVYPELKEKEAFILEQLALEEGRFQRTLVQGMREFEKITSRMEGTHIDGTTAFRLYDTFGFPIEFTLELALEKGMDVDKDGFDEAFKSHQQKSQAGAQQRFKGGLADSSDATARLHTATHLMHAALRNVLGADVAQKGSNITAERLRFDFSFGRKMTREELDEVEKQVNEAITAAVDVVCEEMTVDEAKAQNAIGLFEAKYGDRVKVYTMGSFSKEICGGPHAENTGELVKFKIQKEEASSAGVRRIKAVVG